MCVLYVFMFVCVYVRMYVCMYVFTYNMYTNMNVHICVCISLYQFDLRIHRAFIVSLDMKNALLVYKLRKEGNRVVPEEALEFPKVCHLTLGCKFLHIFMFMI